MDAGVCCAECEWGEGVDPLRPTVETASAVPITPIVATFIRRGVSHVAWLFCSQARAPVAPVAAAIAHIMHMRRRLARLGRRRGAVRPVHAD